MNTHTHLYHVVARNNKNYIVSYTAKIQLNDSNIEYSITSKPFKYYLLIISLVTFYFTFLPFIRTVSFLLLPLNYLIHYILLCIFSVSHHDNPAITWRMHCVRSSGILASRSGHRCSTSTIDTSFTT